MRHVASGKLQTWGIKMLSKRSCCQFHGQFSCSLLLLLSPLLSFFLPSPTPLLHRLLCYQLLCILKKLRIIWGKFSPHKLNWNLARSSSLSMDLPPYVRGIYYIVCMYVFMYMYVCVWVCVESYPVTPWSYLRALLLRFTIYDVFAHIKIILITRKPFDITKIFYFTN